MRKLTSLNEAQLTWSFGLSIERLEEIARDTSRHYHTFPLERNGKTREITAPNRGFKEALRRFRGTILKDLPIHPAAACAPERGVLWAAEKHRIPPYILQLDLADFFPSVSADSVRSMLAWHGCPDETIHLLTRLLMIDGKLPQGAPTSVTVANLILRRLDARIENGTDEATNYTRYVDDITISAGRRVETVYHDRVVEWIEDEGWAVHPEKGGCFGPDERQEMLGMIVNAEVNASPEYVDDLRASLRGIVRGDFSCSPSDLRSLRGKVQWLEHVNPDTTLPRLLSDVEQVVAATTDGKEPKAQHL